MNARAYLVLVLAMMGCSTAPASGAQADSLTQVFKRVVATVVIIQTEHRHVPIGGKQFTDLSGLGSGFLISKDGKVMTAAHVVQTADTIEVMFKNGITVPAKVITSDPAADVALLQLERVPPGALVAKLGDSDRVEVGDQVFVVGAPLGLTHTLTVGHISARRTVNTLYGGILQPEVFQTDAAIHQGNSGGPMFNMRGEVIGIVSHILSQSGGSQGLAFVITSNLSRKLLLNQNPFWSGLQGYLLKGELAKAFNVPQEAGVLVQQVADNSLAARLGLQPGTLTVLIEGEGMIVGGDIILEAQGVPILSERASYPIIRDLLSRLGPGDRISVTVWRKGRKQVLSTKLP